MPGRPLVERPQDACTDPRKRVEVLLLEAKETARRLLSGHRHLVEALVGSLLERNELVGDEITDLLERAAAGKAAAQPAWDRREITSGVSR